MLDRVCSLACQVRCVVDSFTSAALSGRLRPFVLLEIQLLPSGIAGPQELKQNSVADVSKRSVGLVIKITFLPIT